MVRGRLAQGDRRRLAGRRPALAGYWQSAISIPEQGSPPITYDWYREFITFLVNGNHETWFAWVITFGEMAVGIGLILGALTGIAAFFGALMNMSFLLAGSASTNPVLFTAAIGLILAWRVAGYYGLDRYLLPMLGTPWRAPVKARHERLAEHDLSTRPPGWELPADRSTRPGGACPVPAAFSCPAKGDGRPRRMSRVAYAPGTARGAGLIRNRGDHDPAAVRGDEP